MNINKLELNKEYKYKELCSLLETPEKGRGNSRNCQFKDWKRYFLWHKEGQKFIIDEIYDVPKEKVDNRGKSQNSRNNNIYGNSVDIILLNFFNKTSNTTIYQTTNQLAVISGLINKNYGSAFSNKFNFFKYSGKEIELNTTCGFDFFGICKSSLKDIIRSSLKRLEFNKYIIFIETYLLSYEYIVREATQDEIIIIENAEKQTLEELKIENKNILQYNDKLRKRYYVNVNNLVIKNIENIDILYIGYKIIINKELIPESTEDIKQLRENLNNLYKERTLIKIQKIKDKYIQENPYWGEPNPFWGEYVLERLNDNYMEYASYICNILLDLKAKDIKDIIKK